MNDQHVLISLQHKEDNLVTMIDEKPVVPYRSKSLEKRNILS